ncbi:MAG TPA: VWA domain-containing protein [Bacteroidota bacterium]|nr:VWA domain-containing protein [Bacteroidota bacterium]
MMKRFLTAVCLLILFSASTLVKASEKSTFDLAAPPHALSKLSGSIVGSRWTLVRQAAEATLIEGGYFTLGTNHGLSGSTLDDHCTLTYGHPYAKTSYPLVHLDGVWAKPEGVFPSVATTYPQTEGDSLRLVYTLPGKIEMRFVISIDGASGEKIHLRTTLVNLDNVSHVLGAGLIFDPSVGKGGDCALRLGASSPACVNDTAFSASALQAYPVVLSERSSSAGGVALGFTYPLGTPQTMIVSNWNAAHDINTPVYTPAQTRTLYDALLKVFWATQTVAAHASISEELTVALAAPNFGAGVFTRWDLMPTQSIENGIPFPKQFTSMLTLQNALDNQASSRTVNCTIMLPPEMQTSASIRSAVVGGQTPAYVGLPLTIKQIYEDKVVFARVVCTENGTVIDSLVRPFRVCATPVSDTGLTVTIDSVITQRHPKMAVTFDVQKLFPQQYIYTLEPDNIFLYENTQRITNFTLGKDTTGGQGAVDIVFVFDVTGSMSGSINGVKNNIIEFTDSLTRRGVDVRLGMVTFLDAVESVFDFTTDPQTFQTRVSQQYAHGGGDMPENSLDALYRATEFQFRSTARKIFIWITDANYHEKNVNTTRNKQEVIERLLATGVTVHAIGAALFQTDWYNPITQATNGNYYDISGNFRDILLDIGNLRGSNRYMLSYTSPFAQTSTQKDVRLTVHYAGLGGTATRTYLSPSKSLGTSVPAGLACYPNPFNPQTTIRLSIPEQMRASLVIFNALGQEVTHFERVGAADPTEFTWNATNAQGQPVSAGLYFVRATMYSTLDGRALSSTVAKLLYVK